MIGLCKTLTGYFFNLSGKIIKDIFILFNLLLLSLY